MDSGKLGIIITNTGTPDSPTPDAIRPYLAEFLSDPYLISCPPIIWKRVLKYFILPKRPHKSAPRYQAIWTPEGSPFLLTSLKQREKLAEELRERGYDVEVVLAMRYGNPSFKKALDTLCEAGCTQAIVLPLYPQQARVTTQTTLDRINELVAQDNYPLSIHAIPNYFDNPSYIYALAASIHSAHPTFADDDRLLMTFHSTVVKDIEHGDPYRDQIQATCDLLARELELKPHQWSVAYQCRFDSRAWLKPAPEEILARWAQEGITDATVVCPGFSTDCIETSIDCGVEQRTLFMEAAGANATFTYVDCLNARPEHIAALADVIEASGFLSK